METASIGSNRWTATQAAYTYTHQQQEYMPEITTDNYVRSNNVTANGTESKARHTQIDDRMEKQKRPTPSPITDNWKMMYMFCSVENFLVTITIIVKRNNGASLINASEKANIAKLRKQLTKAPTSFQTYNICFHKIMYFINTIRENSQGPC